MISVFDFNLNIDQPEPICVAFRVYIVILTYIKPLEEIDAAIPAQVEWLKKGHAEGIFLASGRRIPRKGGVILA